MGCLSLIVDWYTCHLLVLQVRRLNLTCMSLTLVKCNTLQFCISSVITFKNVITYICISCRQLHHWLLLWDHFHILLSRDNTEYPHFAPIFSFCYQLSDEPHLDGQDQDAAGEKVGVQFISSISYV